MRMLSANALKKGRRCRTQKEPKEGTALRRAYDVLKSNLAYPVELPVSRPSHGRLLEDLRHYYGLDIRVFPEKHSNPLTKRAKYRYWLVGEYVGKDYIDYVAQRREREEKELGCKS